MATILNSVILNSTILDSAILVFPLKHTHMCQDWFSPFAQKNFTHTYLPNICTRKLHSFILTQLDDGGHLEFCHLEFNFCIVELRHLVFFSQIHSKTSPSTLILTQTNSFWLKLIHSHWTWWWQPSWILPTWFQPFCTKNITHSFWLNLMIAAILNIPTCIQPLPSWIQTPCYLILDSLKNTLPLIWLWLKLIHSASNSFIFT